jgi:asparagine N-glycosylation enzyme membrane subunit Stt3
MTEQRKRLFTFYVLTILTIISAFTFSYRQFSNTTEPMSWVHATTALARVIGPEDIILSWWDNGYWLLDQSGGIPYVHNGTHSIQQDRLIAQLYCATSDFDAYLIATSVSARYIVLSKRDENAYPTIKHTASYTDSKQQTFWYRALQPDFSSEYFSILYREKNIVVLETLPHT